nr:MAG TPA: hypothetical protein [Caudoviricetes sp.]
MRVERLRIIYELFDVKSQKIIEYQCCKSFMSYRKII